MSFWAKQLGTPQPAQPPAPAYPQAPPQQPMQPWYATPQYLPQAPAQQPAAAPQEPQEHQGWGDVNIARQKAQSARLTEVCPECGSSNYFRPPGHSNTTLQCFECGSNGRFSQTGGQGGLPSGSSGAAAATPARQIEGAGLGGVSQFNPQRIVDRIS